MSELELKRFKELKNEIYLCGEIWKDENWKYKNWEEFQILNKKYKIYVSTK
jgi:hypothetical protein